MGTFLQEADVIELLNPETVTGLVVLHSERCAKGP